ncbi:hypothetical protein FRC01_003316 [Tulasnella sp. 417]|nr:hypothetical protein FRC01_003316 [Tulasnella sp. 417]
MTRTSTAPSNFTATATASNSSSSNSSQSKRASIAQSQQTQVHPVGLDRAARAAFQAPSSPAIWTQPSFKARISTPKLGTPFKTLPSACLGRDDGEGSSRRGLETLVEEVPPPDPPLPTSFVASNAQARAPGHTETLIDTRPSTAFSDYEAYHDEERKRERPHSWLAEVLGWEEPVLGELLEEVEGQEVSSSSAARAMTVMGS